LARLSNVTFAQTQEKIIILSSKNIMKTKNYLILILTILSFVSCTKEDTQTTERRLKDCNAGYLYFKDDITLPFNATFNYVPGTDAVCSYEYTGQDMTKLTGGIITIATGSNFNNLLFSEDAYDSICHIGNDIYIFTKYKVNGGIMDDINNPLIFGLNSSGQLVKISKRNAVFGTKQEFFFNYSPGLITETDSTGTTLRKFYFSNNNLTKVTSETYNLDGKIFSKREIVFEGFDDKINPFKNKYYIRGAFFRAFSQNNYKSYTSKEYIRSGDSLVLTNSFWQEMPIRYDSYGYPMFGDYE